MIIPPRSCPGECQLNMASLDSKTQERILHAAAERDALHQIISSSDDANAARLESKRDRLTILARLDEASETAYNLQKALDTLKRTLRDIESSHTRKLFNRSKWQQELNKAAEKCVEAQNFYDKAKHARELLENELERNGKETAALETILAGRTQAQIDLEQLYSSVFDGPTPANAEEDGLEEATGTAQEVMYETMALTHSRY